VAAEARWPPAWAYFGLHVDLGDWHSKRHIWLRLPTATFTCRHGCERTAVGATDVADLTEDLDQAHAPNCPARSAPPTAREPSHDRDNAPLPDPG
jgi:hypothetical protein